MPPTTFNTLAGIGDDNGHARVLVEDLLNAAGVVTSFTLGGNVADRLFGFVEATGDGRLAKRWTLIVFAGRWRSWSFEGAD